MPKSLSLEQQRFGKLLVVSKSGTDKRGCILWECLCDCGKTTIVNGAKLKNGHTRSCGCLARDGSKSATHRETGTRLYRIWQAMKNRCLNEKMPAYCYYGGRGIKVCDEWLHSFEAFRDWALANGYRDDLTIDRIDVNGNYEPANCRWTTQKEQNRNTRKNIIVEYAGERRTLKEWSEILGINYQTLHSRVCELGWSIEDALTKREGV